MATWRSRTGQCSVPRPSGSSVRPSLGGWRQRTWCAAWTCAWIATLSEAESSRRTTRPVLTPDQQGCVSAIESAIDGPSSHVFLLHGVTGSGKTEVYLRSLAHAISRGKRGIVMAPELSLTPQTIDRFSRRFPGKVAVQHSGLSAGERFDQWWRIKEGDYGVTIGARSAVFAPQPDLGLIVIDEEHEPTYKQDNAPRYHAREAALKLADLTGAVVVLGTATPDVVTYTRAVNGRYRLLKLPDRIAAVAGARSSGAGSQPSVQVVDLRRELEEGNRSIFSRALSRGIGRSVEAGEQVILYLNRRGSGSMVQCRDCGHVMRCSRCEIYPHTPRPGRHAPLPPVQLSPQSPRPVPQMSKPPDTLSGPRDAARGRRAAEGLP